MNHNRYEQIIRGFAGRRVAVVGDLMLDAYLWGRATRISPESPVMVVEVDRESCVPGGAANVANNLLALGASVAVSGVVGDDEGGRDLVEDLRNRGAEVGGIIVDCTRPTTRKTRIVAHDQQMIRFDREDRRPVDSSAEVALIDSIRRLTDAAEGMLISDYCKGVVTRDVAAEAVSRAGTRGIPLTANPKPASARYLVGAHTVQLNQSEAETVLGDGRFHDQEGPERDVAGRELRCLLRANNLLVTHGSKGLTVWTSDDSVHRIPPHPVEVYDVAGAGDTVISALTLAILTGAQIHEAADVANHAAACVVRKLGVATVTTHEILADWRETRA